MKEFINLTLALVKKYREQWNYLYLFKLPGRRKFYLNSFIYAVPVYILLTSLWFFPLSILSGLFFGDSKALVETADGEYPTAFLLYPGVIFSLIFFWFRLQKIIEKEKKDLKAKKDAVDFAKQEELKEKENLIKVKESLNELIFKDKTSFENSKRNWKNKYSQIINKISEEQAELKNLGERHPAVINMLNTRGVDDLNKEQVFVELKTRLKI